MFHIRVLKDKIICTGTISVSLVGELTIDEQDNHKVAHNSKTIW
jgi:hypothetical protein